MEIDPLNFNVVFKDSPKLYNEILYEVRDRDRFNQICDNIVIKAAGKGPGYSFEKSNHSGVLSSDGRVLGDQKHENRRG